MFSLDVFAKILELNIGVSQADNARMFELLNTIYPLSIKRYAAGREHNGWVVPHDWVVKKALIKKDGKVVYDGAAHPMAVGGYSCSFQGKLAKKELDQRIFRKTELPHAIPFHCTFNYRPWLRDWAFCVPHDQWVKWPDGEYEVDLQTQYLPGDMLVGECEHPGELSDTIVFNAHTCHPCQFNDDLAGVAVILELFKWLQSRKMRYTYRGVFAPEHLGTVFYLADMPAAERKRLKLCSFVEMVGIDKPFALQKSFLGTSILDRVAESVLRGHDATRQGADLKVGAFRTVVGNDETVWEAPGVEIPCISISRCSQAGYYPQYHTSDDSLKNTSEVRLGEALDVLKQIVLILEGDRSIVRKFEGIVALSNPKYMLYIERPDPTVDKKLSQDQLKLGGLQDALPRYFDGKHSVYQIAERFGLSFELVASYLQRFADKGLVETRPLSGLDDYKTLGTA